jgi:hypothetical protein
VRDGRLAQHVHRLERRERRRGSRFDDDRAPGGHGRGDLVQGQEQRVVEAGDADDDADRSARPEADEAVAGRQQVERDRLAVQARGLRGGGLERDEGAAHLDPAVDERLARLEHEQVLQLTGARAQRRGGVEQHGAAHRGRQGRDLGPDGERLVDGPPRLLGRADRRDPDDRPVVREADLRRPDGRQPAGPDRQPLRAAHARAPAKADGNASR